MMHHTRAHVWSGKRMDGHPCPPSPPSSTLEVLAERVARLSPSHRDPERFHMDKAELVRELRRLARSLGRVA